MNNKMEIFLVVAYTALVIVKAIGLFFYSDLWQVIVMGLLLVGYLVLSHIIFERRAKRIKVHYLFPLTFARAIETRQAGNHPREQLGYIKWIGSLDDCIEIMEDAGKGGVIVDSDWNIVHKQTK